MGKVRIVKGIEVIHKNKNGPPIVNLPLRRLMSVGC